MFVVFYFKLFVFFICGGMLEDVMQVVDIDYDFLFMLNLIKYDYGVECFNYILYF